MCANDHLVITDQNRNPPDKQCWVKLTQIVQITMNMQMYCKQPFPSQTHKRQSVQTGSKSPCERWVWWHYLPPCASSMTIVLMPTSWLWKQHNTHHWHQQKERTMKRELKNKQVCIYSSWYNRLPCIQHPKQTETVTEEIKFISSLLKKGQLLSQSLGVWPRPLLSLLPYFTLWLFLDRTHILRHVHTKYILL